MKLTATNTNEYKAAEAFSKQSKVFDELYDSDQIIAYKRQRVREHLLQFLKPQSTILELNCGTGEDAIYFAEQGHHAHATDISVGMLEELKAKVEVKQINQNISTELCSFTHLHELKNKGPYDAAFSNFGGLNCTDELDRVLYTLSPLIKPKGTITLVIISKFCLWETLLVFKGKFRTAFRRFFSKEGRRAHVEGNFFNCWYYSPGYIVKTLKKDFDLISVEGLCTIVPPSYIEHFGEKHPNLFSFLKRKENKLKEVYPWKFIGDYFITTLRKK
jgi:ubiquinone/menaquinone biosynthesis C-methylase UbiE